MHKVTLMSVLYLGVTVCGQDIDANDIPSQCKNVCQSLADATQRCDSQTDDNNNAYLQCVCGITSAASAIPNCAACISQYGDQENDAGDLVRKCSFSSTTYDAAVAVTSSAGGVQSSSTATPAITTTTSTLSDTGSGQPASTSTGYTGAAPRHAAKYMATLVPGLGLLAAL